MKPMFFAVSLAVALAAQAVPATRAEQTFATVPRAAWVEADPADSLYRSARRALSQKEYEVAARTFDAIVTRFPRSEYAPDALYWKGFALYRNGSFDEAADALEAQAKRYPQATTRGDAAALLIQVKGQLARRGDASAQADVTRVASQSGLNCDELEVVMAALDAVQQMDAERAVPLLRRVLARRDNCSKPLRKNALFILAQKSGGERERILLDIAKTDPDAEIRKDAVFHLQQATSEGADAALEDILLHSDERGVRQNALFALAQHRSERARNILRSFALSESAPIALRNDAVFHIARSSDPDASRWLATVITDARQPEELRKNALFHLAQRKAEGRDELIGVYDKVSVPLKKEVIFHIAQRGDAASLDKLIAIAKTDPTPALRKEALFHIGQSKDPRALKALEEIVNP
ncbi:MAG: HEAT repeat domain-containing protein [bacterium]